MINWLSRGTIEEKQLYTLRVIAEELREIRIIKEAELRSEHFIETLQEEEDIER